MFKSKLLNTLILTALSAPGLALAADAPATPPAVTANVGFVTNYLYRGISQTGGKPAIQGGFDYAHASGFYAGVWGSNISWLFEEGYVNSSGSLELDTYFGFKNSFATDFSYDVGFLRYNYPGNYLAGATKADTNEIYGLIGWKWLTAKYSYSLTNLFGFTDSSGSGYFDLSGNYTLADSGVTLGAHYGKQSVKNNSAAEYSDYNVKASMPFGAYTWAFMISKTNLTGYDKAKGVLSVSHSM